MTSDAGAVLAEVARAAVAAQSALDERARAAAAQWDQSGIPPWAGAFAGRRADLETRLGVAPRSAASEPSRLLLLGAGRCPARVGFRIALRPTERS